MTRCASRVLLLGLAAASACEPQPCGDGMARLAEGSCVPVYDSGSGDNEHGYSPLSAGRLLRRMSLDLLGTVPPPDTVAAVATDPNSLPAARRSLLDDPRLEARFVHLLHEVWQTRVDELLIHHFEYPHLAVDDTVEYAYERAVGEEPLRLMARIAVEDRPWTDILLVDWTLTTPLLEGIWPVAAEEPGEGWRTARYTDARPPAGILSTNGLWWRYYTTASNHNRSRAAMLSRLLVCDDILARPVSFESVESAEDAGEEAVRTSRDCIGCHATVDPVAATLFGFYTTTPNAGEENARYHPERALGGAEALGVEPAWYGQPVEGLSGLGRTIAADPRFVSCATETVARLLWRVPAGAASDGELQRVERGFREGGLRMKALLEAVLQTARYQAGRAGAEGADRTARVLRPDQLAHSVEDLTGFAWTWEGFDQLDADTWGYRLLLGGTDGIQVTTPLEEPSVTAAAVQREVAWAGGSTLAARALSGEPTVLGEIDGGTTPGHPDFATAVEQLTLSAHGQAADETLQGQLSDLWTAAEQASGPETAWAALVAAVLSDPLFLTY